MESNAQSAHLDTFLLPQRIKVNVLMWMIVTLPGLFSYPFLHWLEDSLVQKKLLYYEI